MPATTINIYRCAGEWCYASFLDGQFDESGTLGCADDASEAEAREEAARQYPTATITRVADV